MTTTEELRAGLYAVLSPYANTIGDEALPMIVDDLDTYIRTRLNTSPTAQTEGWRDIASAPKDGDDFVTYESMSDENPKAFYRLVYWSHVDGRFRERHGGIVGYATHWMRPDPPSPPVQTPQQQGDDHV